MNPLIRGLAALALIALAPAIMADEPPAAESPAQPEPPVTPAPQAEAVLVTDLVTGIGDEALPGHTVVVHYIGWLFDASAPGKRGRPFDSSRDRRQPFSFPLGAAHVIKGWEQGVPGMKVGGLRQLVIPPSLGYGARNIADGLIPPHSTLLFEIELLAVETVTLAPQAQ
ncbi:MAG TPA: FKBP-type peptidyl-prolyl cis-trans isomerase [Steroidobacteraceae bacterium]|nr:FKBP-type peptidyl-prolyl cis-trans isomerase [Steroidobacteraceae bacterium]